MAAAQDRPRHVFDWLRGASGVFSLVRFAGLRRYLGDWRRTIRSNRLVTPVGPWYESDRVCVKMMRSMGSAVGANITDRQRTFFSENGFLAVENLVAKSKIETYREIVDGLVEGRIESGDSRSDLGGHRPRVRPSVENIIHIMLPSEAVPWLATSPFFVRSRDIARALLGDDLERDMDMLIDKEPHTDTSTPWHQDQAYWLPGMPDRRSVSCWLALDETTLDNGCMWFVPGSHRQPVRMHRHSGETSHALETDASESEAVACPLVPGSATFHDGGTLHYSRGNSTSSRRRALITNFRPVAMIEWEREHGYDHRNELDQLGVESEHVISRQE